MQVSIACNVGGGGGSGGGMVSEHPPKERRLVLNTNSTSTCQAKIRAEPSIKLALLGHAHMKEALGHHGNMKYR